MRFLTDLPGLFLAAGRGFMADKAPRLGAALAFYIALSLSPLLLVVLAIAGAAFGDEAARGELVGQIRDLVGQPGAEVVESILANANQSGSGTLATVIGIAALLFSATGVFVELQDSLDTVWRVDEKRGGGGVWSLVKDRLLSLSMIGALAFLLLVSLVFSAVLSAMSGLFDRWFPDASTLLKAANLTLAFLLTVAMFAVTFKVLPNVAVPWRGVWVGAVLTAALFTLGKYLIGLYLSKASVGSAYGAAGSFVALLVWIYYSTQILLFGAEFTRAYVEKHYPVPKDIDGKPLPETSPDGPPAEAARNGAHVAI